MKTPAKTRRSPGPLLQTLLIAFCLLTAFGLQASHNRQAFNYAAETAGH